MSKRSLSLLLAALALAPACGTPAEDTAADDAAGEPISRTVVRLQADGTRTVTTEQISREQQRAAVAARQARREQRDAAEGVGQRQQAIMRDPGCSNDSLWIYSRQGFAGSEICFIAPGTVGNYHSAVVSLDDFCQLWSPAAPFRPPVCLRTWASSVGSYYSGAQSGWFDIGDGTPTASFTPFLPVVIAGPTAQAARYLELGDYLR